MMESYWTSKKEGRKPSDMKGEEVGPAGCRKKKITTTTEEERFGSFWFFWWGG